MIRELLSLLLLLWQPLSSFTKDALISEPLPFWGASLFCEVTSRGESFSLQLIDSASFSLGNVIYQSISVDVINYLLWDSYLLMQYIT